MSELFRRSLSYCLHCWPFLLLVTAMFMIMDRVLPSSTSSSATIVHGFVLLFFHQYFLYGADYLTFSGARALKAAGRGQPKILRFLLVYLGLCFWPLIVVVVLASAGLSLTAVMAVMLLCIGIGFVFFGTLLPHSIEQHPDYRLRAALAVAGRVTVQVIVGPVLFAIGGIIVVFGLLLLASFIPASFQEVALLVIDALAYLSGFVVSAMLAIIFCDTYRQITAGGSSSAPAA